jgi:hypothetical protein
MSIEKGRNLLQEIEFEPSTDLNILLRPAKCIAITRFASSC